MHIPPTSIVTYQRELKYVALPLQRLARSPCCYCGLWENKNKKERVFKKFNNVRKKFHQNFSATPESETRTQTPAR